MNKFCFLSLIILVGAFSCAPLMAQTADPFGDVDDSKYSNTMNITGYVRFAEMVNGQWSVVGDQVLGNETVVAVYCGDELRGKGSPADFNDKYFSLLMLTVYGEELDPLHFKVYTDGRVVEFAPDGFTFMTDQRLGKAKEPYYIDLPAPVVTTFSPEGWATTCLPFDARVPDGVTLYDATAIENNELVKEKLKANVLPKGIPAILQLSNSELPNGQIEWLSAVIDEETAAANSQLSLLKGTTGPTTVAANGVLTLGHSDDSGELGFWLYSGTTIPANRAYIADFPAGSRGAKLSLDDGSTTRISEIVNGEWPNSKCFDIQGRKLPNRQINKGLYIVNGHKMVTTN